MQEKKYCFSGKFYVCLRIEKNIYIFWGQIRCVFSEQIKLKYPSSATCCANYSVKFWKIMPKAWGRSGRRLEDSSGSSLEWGQSEQTTVSGKSTEIQNRKTRIILQINILKFVTYDKVKIIQILLLNVTFLGIRDDDSA